MRERWQAAESCMTSLWEGGAFGSFPSFQPLDFNSNSNSYFSGTILVTQFPYYQTANCRKSQNARTGPNQPLPLHDSHRARIPPTKRGLIRATISIHHGSITRSKWSSVSVYRHQICTGESAVRSQSGCAAGAGSEQCCTPE